MNPREGERMPPRTLLDDVMESTSIIFAELDGPRSRQIHLQALGE